MNSRLAHRTILRDAVILAPFLGSALTGLIVSACISSTEPVEVVTWQAELIALDGVPDLMGSAAMVIGERQTQMGISVRDAIADATLGWAVRDGTCAALGERVGPAATYPAIEVSGSGTGAVETVLFRRIPTAGPYAVAVYANANGTGAVLACADLVQQS